MTPIADNDHPRSDRPHPAPLGGNGLPAAPLTETHAPALFGLPQAIARRWRAARGRTGHVTLVGAGPGDAELLTLKAVRAIQAADVILFDALVSDEVLAFARSRARLILVGKRGGRRSCRQDEINDTMLALAKGGRRVVRLKSGDPMVFGRGGEEVEACRRAGVAVEVVPGITTALALSARLGVSLTHRDAARSVRFVTGHARSGRLPDDLDWHGLADPATSLMVYMGGAQARLIAERLVAHGLSGATPCVVAASVSRPDETVWAGPLTALAQGVACITDGAPVLVGIGQAFAQASAIDMCAGAQALRHGAAPA